jgi:hypothetical protein
MNRRDALRYTGLALGYATTAGSLAAMMQSCQADVASDGWTPSTLSQDQVDLVAELAETLLPATDTPGAKDVFVHRYIDEYITGFLNEENRSQTMTAMASLESYLNEAGASNFVSLSADERNEVLSALNKAALSAESPDEVQGAYLQLKRLVIDTYFTSEKIGEEVLAYVPIPGPFQSCIPYEEVGKVWAPNR